MRDGLRRASFIGFTGTPIELKDANTRAVFGEYIDICDIKPAVDDHATVNIYYEGRLAKLGLDPVRLPGSAGKCWVGGSSGRAAKRHSRPRPPTSAGSVTRAPLG